MEGKRKEGEGSGGEGREGNSGRGEQSLAFNMLIYAMCGPVDICYVGLGYSLSEGLSQPHEEMLS